MKINYLICFNDPKLFILKLLHAKFITELNLHQIFSRENQNRATWITFTLACMINFILLFYFNGEDCFRDENQNHYHLPPPLPPLLLYVVIQSYHRSLELWSIFLIPYKLSSHHLR